MPFLDYKKQILDLGFREDGFHLLEGYVQMLWESNEELNLVSRKMTFQELIENHVIDCLLPLKEFPQNITSFADFGSGGGLPGVIYAIQFPHMKATLYEKSNLKREFLEKCKKFAPQMRIKSEVPPDLEPTDIVMSRAFKSADIILIMNQKYFLRGGSYFLFKARREKIDEDLKDIIKKYPKLNYQIIPLKSPVLEVERHLLLIQPKSS